MIITAPSVLAALGVILFGGMALWVVYYILNTPARRRRREQEDEF